MHIATYELICSSLYKLFPPYVYKLYILHNNNIEFMIINRVSLSQENPTVS